MAVVWNGILWNIVAVVSPLGWSNFAGLHNMAPKPHLIDETARLTADEIFDAAYASGREELERSSTALLFSGLIAGLTIEP